MGAGSSIIVCGKRYDIGNKVVTFEDDPNFSAYTPHRTDDPKMIPPFQPAKGMEGAVMRYRPRRLMGGDRSIDRLRQVLKQFVLHHDGCMDSKMCFHVLHNERGLSVHFLIDNDGTIYQTLDLVDCGFQAAGVNEIAIGVELANRGDAIRFPNLYGGKRDKVTCTIHNHQFLCYDYTKEQLEAMAAIGRGLARIFPNLPQAYPEGPDREQLWTALDGDPREFQGYLAHYHVTNQKWDPGPFDFKKFVTNIRSRSFFPIVPSGDKPELPDAADKVEDIANQLFESNEGDGEGGYFPVGPFGTSRLWHTGIHVRGDKGTPVYAPYAGKIVAARMTEDCPVGSRNFVLIKHELAIGQAKLGFYSLLFHLDLEKKGPNAPAWFAAAADSMGDDPIALSVDVAAGEIVGHCGEAGPPGRFEGQVHIEIMANEEIGDKLQPGFWKRIDGSSSGRFCNAPEIIDKIDTPVNGKKDGVLTRPEFINFFRNNPAKTEFRKFTVKHLSEWSDKNDWPAALAQSPEYKAMPPAQRQRLYDDQIKPVLWWNDEIGAATGLPGDKVVWSYHPVTFVVWLHDRMLNARSTSKGISNAGNWAGKGPPSFLKDDFDATEGFTDDEDLLYGDAAKKLELEDLAKGFPDDAEKK